MVRENESNPISVSVVILTMNRSEHLKEVLINLNKQQMVELEIIVVDNNSENLHQENNKSLSQNFNAHYYLLDSNLGVSGGRNYGLSKCTHDYIIEIDDDAYFINDTAIKDSIFYFFKFKDVGLLAFNILSDSSENFRPHEYPFLNKKKKKITEYGAWFIGAGHAFKKDMLEKVGFYRDFSPYGQEEIDLSIRFYNYGYKILFCEDIKVVHNKTIQGRYMPNLEVESINLKNRLKVALLNLNYFSIFTYFLIRSTQFLIKYKSIWLIFNAYKMLFKDRKYIYQNRKMISWSSFFELIKLKGPVFF
ncbi:MAG: glycosyltransferase [Hydrogenophilales bacterium]